MSTAGWVLLWVGLVLAALVFFALLGVFLFRKAMGLLRQAQGSTEILEAFAEASETSPPVRSLDPIAVLASDTQRDAWRRTRRLNRIRRTKRKRARRETTLRRWHGVLLDPPKV